MGKAKSPYQKYDKIEYDYSHVPLHANGTATPKNIAKFNARRGIVTPKPRRNRRSDNILDTIPVYTDFDDIVE